MGQFRWNRRKPSSSLMAENSSTDSFQFHNRFSDKNNRILEEKKKHSVEHDTVILTVIPDAESIQVTRARRSNRCAHHCVISLSSNESMMIVLNWPVVASWSNQISESEMISEQFLVRRKNKKKDRPASCMCIHLTCIPTSGSFKLQQTMISFRWTRTRLKPTRFHLDDRQIIDRLSIFQDAKFHESSENDHDLTWRFFSFPWTRLR